MNCEFCVALSGRFNAHRECCQIRLLAGTPQHVRQVAYDQVRREDGETALAGLKAKLRAEVQRQRELAYAQMETRLNQEAAIGRAAATALLTKMKDEKMNVAPLERANARRQDFLLEHA